jgi:glycosyltransferase involved in cell wall biosynthesis
MFISIVANNPKLPKTPDAPDNRRATHDGLDNEGTLMGIVYLGKKFLRQMHKGGLRAAVGASLLYCGRRLNRRLNLPTLDEYLRNDPNSYIRHVPYPLVGSAVEQANKWLRCYHVDPEDVQQTQEINREWRRQPCEIKRALWLMPDFRNVHNGGPNTILRQAHYLADLGIHNTIVIFNGSVHKSSEEVQSEVAEVFGDNSNIEFVVHPAEFPLLAELLPDSDICFATLWHTAYTLTRYHRTRAKFYFIQDYESLFYPANHEFALADQTYELGFFGLFNTPGLAEAVCCHHPIEGKAFIPGIDADIFYPPLNRPRNDYKKIFFYGRPEVPRNGYELGVAGLREIQFRFPDVEIFIAGHHEDYSTTGLRAHFLEYQDYRNTGNLYRSCDFVLGFMFTPHPSYIPLQAMACGTIPICIDNPYIRWIIRDKDNALAVRPSPQAICEAYSYLRSNPEERRRMRGRTISAAPFASWERVLSENYEWIRSGAINQLGAASSFDTANQPNTVPDLKLLKFPKAA